VDSLLDHACKGVPFQLSVVAGERRLLRLDLTGCRPGASRRNLAFQKTTEEGRVKASRQEKLAKACATKRSAMVLTQKVSV
jgi:hypothetical protein